MGVVVVVAMLEVEVEVEELAATVEGTDLEAAMGDGIAELFEVEVEVEVEGIPPEKMATSFC